MLIFVKMNVEVVVIGCDVCVWMWDYGIILGDDVIVEVVMFLGYVVNVVFVCGDWICFFGCNDVFGVVNGIVVIVFCIVVIYEI